MSTHEQTLDWREHWNVAQRFRQRGIDELRAGDDLVGSELMWGAAARATKAVAAKLGMRHGSHSDLFWVARRLSDESGVEGLQKLLGKASSLHAHFYESELSPRGIETGVAAANEFIEVVAMVLGASARNGNSQRGQVTDTL